jgi:protein-S-isoprenylcysteine O-methyltransferase Ste14
MVEKAAPHSGAGLADLKPRPWWVRARACIGIAILIPFGCVAFFSQPWGAPGSVAALAWEAAGWILLVAGTTIRFWATAYVGGHKRIKLVSDGPYSLCRNPLYLGTFLITLSVAAFVESPVFAAGVLLASCVYLMTTIPFEESDLRERLGAEYLEYCRRVPRFWPRLSGFRTPPTVELDVRCLGVESVRALRWAVIPLVAHLVLQLQAAMHR